MLSSLLLAAAGIVVTLTNAQAVPFSEQLLQTINANPSTDPLIGQLIASVESSSQLLNNDIGRRGPADPTSRAQRACRMLKGVLPKYYTDATNQTAYNILRTKNWSSNCELPAACFVTPEHPVQVAVALQIISRVQSKFTVRSGGHNPNPGFASIGAEGVSIDTQGFATLQLNADKSIATVGAGLRFGAVQSFLDNYGVAVVSGRNKDVGVSGLLLGGGHPIINSLTGLAADNIESAEVVLSNFRVVKASRTENPDLFRALKGGLNNFGIVTKFELKTTMPRNIWYRSVIYNATDPRTFFHALAQVQTNLESDPKAGIAALASPDSFAVAFVYAEYTHDPAVFAPFRNITPASERQPATNGTTVQFIDLQTSEQPAGTSIDSVGVTTYPDADLYLDFYNRYLGVVRENEENSTLFLLSMHTFGVRAAEIAERNGGNVLGNSRRAQSWWSAIAAWGNPDAGDRAHNTLVGLGDYLKGAAEPRGLYDGFIFANIASWSQNVLRSYGVRNLEFMRAVARRYDARGMFQRLQNGGFLLSKS